MSYPITNVTCVSGLLGIDGTDCIGDSRIIINNNTQKLGEAICSLSGVNLNVADTNTINHTYNTSNFLLTSEVINNSITNAKLAFDGGAFSYKNKVINGNFDFWQRSTVFSGTGPVSYSGPDRWAVYANKISNASSPTFTVSRTACTDTELQYFSANYFQRLNLLYTNTFNDLNTNTNIYYHVLALQSIENATEILGKTVTLSFWARSSQTTKIFSESQIYTNADTGNQFWTPTICKVFNLTQNWQKFTHTYTMPTYNQVVNAAYNPNIINTTLTNPPYTVLGVLPPIEKWLYQVDIKFGWSLGGQRAAGNAYAGSRPSGFENTELTLAEMTEVNNSIITNGYYDIAQIQLEVGPTATPFEHRPLGTELKLCQRYYEKSYDLEAIPGTPGATLGMEVVRTYGILLNTSNGGLESVSFNTTKRATPTVRIYSPVTGAVNAFRDWNFTDRAAFVAYVGTNRFESGYLGSNANIGAPCYQWTADAEIY